jgi:hypothetical protein
LADLNRQVRDWLALTANVRIHGTTGEAPCARWPQEGLTPLLDKPDYDTRVIVFRRSTKDCYVAYDGNYYSVPADQAQQLLQLQVAESGQLLILDAQGQVVAEHSLVPGRNQRLSVPVHFVGLFARTPRPAAPQARQTPASPTLAGWPVPEVEIRPLSWYDALLETPA